MSSSTLAREQLWTGLRSVAIPDSRFHYRFSEFIPDFAGSGQAMDALCSLPAYQKATHVFVGDKPVSPEQMELARLRAENARFRMERDILGKATAYFAKGSL